MKDGQRDTSGRLDLLMKSADTHWTNFSWANLSLLHCGVEHWRLIGLALFKMETNYHELYELPWTLVDWKLRAAWLTKPHKLAQTKFGLVVSTLCRITSQLRIIILKYILNLGQSTKKTGTTNQMTLGLLYQGLGPDAYGKMWYTNGNRLPGRSLCRFSHAFPPASKSGKIHLRWLIYFWVAQPPSSHASSMNSYILAAYRTQLVRVSAWAAWLGCCPLVWHSVHRHIHFFMVK
jgi:hypothetical protein